MKRMILLLMLLVSLSACSEDALRTGGNVDYPTVLPSRNVVVRADKVRFDETLECWDSLILENGTHYENKIVLPVDFFEEGYRKELVKLHRDDGVETVLTVQVPTFERPSHIRGALNSGLAEENVSVFSAFLECRLVVHIKTDVTRTVDGASENYPLSILEESGWFSCMSLDSGHTDFTCESSSWSWVEGMWMELVRELSWGKVL